MTSGEKHTKEDVVTNRLSRSVRPCSVLVVRRALIPFRFQSLNTISSPFFGQPPRLIGNTDGCERTKKTVGFRGSIFEWNPDFARHYVYRIVHCLVLDVAGGTGHRGDPELCRQFPACSRTPYRKSPNVRHATPHISLLFCYFRCPYGE